jgi:hypothetical protein
MRLKHLWPRVFLSIGPLNPFSFGRAEIFKKVPFQKGEDWPAGAGQ